MPVWDPCFGDMNLARAFQQLAVRAQTPKIQCWSPASATAACEGTALEAILWKDRCLAIIIWQSDSAL